MIIITITFIAGVTSAVNISVQTGVQYDMWKSSESDEGSQFYIPLTIRGSYKDFSLLLLTGYANTSSDISGSDSASLSSPLDTKVNFSYAVIEKLPVDVLIGLDVNLPTGKTNLKEEELTNVLDPDLISITNFGEGFNINPTLTVVKEWGDWLSGIGIGYSWRGKYDFSESTQDYNPGNIFNVTGEVRYYFLPDWDASLFGAYVNYGEDEVNDEEFFKNGDLLKIGMGFHHTQTMWDSAFSLRSILRDKDEFQGKKISNGIEWIGDLVLRYFLNDKMTLKSSLEGLLITDSDYFGDRKKATIGLGASRMISPRFEIELTGKGFYMQSEKNQFTQTSGELDYWGVSALAFLTGWF